LAFPVLTVLLGLVVYQRAWVKEELAAIREEQAAKKDLQKVLSLSPKGPL
jgi:hypothetical protein